MAVKITDLVDENEIKKLKDLDAELSKVLSTYTDVAKSLAKGLDINVRVVGDIDKLEQMLITKGKEAATVQQQLTRVVEEQSRVVANTTNTISRHLMEQERVNKAQREAYTEQDKVKKILEQVHDTYGEQLKTLVKVEAQLKANSKEQKENEKALASGVITSKEYISSQAELIAQHRELTQVKRTLRQVMTAEEKMNQTQEGSYVHMSQQLELLKKALKDLSDEGRNSDFGKELEESIQNLDAHLKDMAADMGEFQRNVGNYAIAGKEGVATTESVIAAINQQAITTQDLVDQTKILEDAKRMLNKEDENYQSTLEALNARIEENKRQLSDVSDILNKDATSVGEAEEQNKRLKEALKHVDLTSADAKKRIEELNAKIAANTKLIQDNTPAIRDETKALEEQRKSSEGLAGNLLSLAGVNTKFGSSLKSLQGLETASVLDGLNIKVKAFTKTLLGLLANPWVLAFLGIAGVAAGFKWWYDYNKGLLEASRLTENFTGLTGEAADKVTTDLQAVADHMDKSYEDTIGAANTLVQQFGISWEEAIAKIEDGIEAGADMSGNFIENIDRFAPALRDAGVSADELVAILAETRNGIFDESAVNDMVKGGTRLRSMTKQVAKSLDAVGISSEQMQKDLAEGNITMLDAIQQVAGKLKELPENSQEAGNLMKNVFGRAAAEGGTLLIQSIADVNTNLDVAKERMGDLGKITREEMDAQKELSETIAAVFKMSGTSFEEMTLQAKTYIANGLKNIIVNCVDLINWFIRLYNRSIAVRGSVNSIVNAFKTLWEVAKFILGQIVNSLKSAGTVIEGILTWDWDLVRKGFQDGMNALKDNVVTMAKNIASNCAEAFNNTIEGEMKELSVTLDADISGATSANSPQKPPYTPPTPELSDKEKNKLKKEAEKRAKEELKRLQELEDSKIAMMEDSHEKDLALIRLNFKKKLDKITGNSKTENELRLQLAEQCQKELADCELKYQQELSKINLSNRLAMVKEGSQEELTLKLAQLEAQRAAEIKAAKKTGADIELINAKFNAQRQKMEEDYAEKAVAKVQEMYANEQAERDTAYVTELNALKQKYATELAEAKGNKAKQEKLQADFEDDQARLSEKYAKETAMASVKMLEDVLKNDKLSAEDRLKFEQELAKAKADLEGVMADASIAEINRITKADSDANEKRKANAQSWLQVAADSLNTISDLVSSVYDAKIQKVEEEQEANTAAGEAEIERIEGLVEKQVITEEEGEARKRAAEEQTARKNEELEKKKQQLQYKQAVWDKANSIAQVGINTAMAIMTTAGQLGFPAAIPFIAIAGAMGAVQLATILATPIPKYAKGTDKHKGGPAIVGDGGVPELVMFGGKSWITPDKPTLVDLPAGAVVIPNIVAIGDAASGVQPLPPSGDNNTPVIVNNDYRRLEEKMDKFISEMRRHSNRQHRLSVRQAMNQFAKDKI